MPINPTSGATIRADVNIKVEEAAASDHFFIGSRVMPPFSVEAKSGTYPKIQIAAGELMSAGSTVRERGGSYGEVSRQWTNDSYDCLDRGLEEAVDDTDIKDLARFFNLEVATARWLLRNMTLDHEMRVAAQIMSTTNFGSATNSAVAYTVANLATIDFAQDVLAAVERVNDNGGLANTLILSSAVLNRLKLSAKLQSFVRGSVVGETQSPINAESLAKAFADHGITHVLVGRARYNTAKKGQAKSMSPVWGNTYVWVGQVNQAASALQDGGAGFTLVWNAEGSLFVTEGYRCEERRSNVIRVRQHTAEKVVDPTCGTLIATQYS